MRLRLLFILALLAIAIVIFGSMGMGKVLTGRDILHTENVAWYEYKVEGPMGGDDSGFHHTKYTKFVFDNVTLDGSAMRHILMMDRYYDLGKNQTRIDDMYWDATGNTALHRHVVGLVNGTVKEIGKDLPGDLRYKYEDWHDTNSIMGWVLPVNFTSVGMETLTINGTEYHCVVYSGTTHGNNAPIFMWVDPAVPVPVKIYVIEEHVVSHPWWNLELTGWGMNEPETDVNPFANPAERTVSELQPAGTHSTPAQAGHTVPCVDTSGGFDVEYNLTLLEVVRGDDAWARIHTADSTASMPGPACEYLMAKFRYELIKCPGERSVKLTSDWFDAYETSFYGWLDPINGSNLPLQGVDGFDGTVRQGDIREGYIAFEVPTDTNITISFTRGDPANAGQIRLNEDGYCPIWHSIWFRTF